LHSHNIALIKQHVASLDNNREQIVDNWLSIPPVQEILEKYDIDVSMFAMNYAHPVLNYFIGVIQGTNIIGDCPVITKLLEYLHDKNIAVSELFIICINFRKSMINILFAKHLMSEEMYSNISYIFDANFRGVLSSFTDTISKAKAESKRLYDISTKDHLTKIFNRKKFDEIFYEEITQANNINKQLSLVLIDIDFFKKINDNYGHNAGDNTLVQLVTIIKQYIRKSDIFSRWGGEEFVILAPKATKENIAIKIEQIRKAIESYSFNCVGQVTCSFGITDYIENDTESAMFKRVDKALYNSKENGRNRITIA